MPGILIIDDERAIRNTLGEILQHEGYKVDVAEDGEQGLKLFTERQYDVVLCDIKMPKMDGLEVLDKARQANPDVPIIMISGHGTIETAVEAVKNGAYDFISKPPDLNRLLITLRNAMDKNTLVAETKTLKKRIARVQEIVGESAAGGTYRCSGADNRRKRGRQRTCSPMAARAECPCQWPPGRGELRCHSFRTYRKRIVWPRKGFFYLGYQAAHRQV
jgi:CheY-like chemotaxis protein